MRKLVALFLATLIVLSSASALAESETLMSITEFKTYWYENFGYAPEVEATNEEVIVTLPHRQTTVGFPAEGGKVDSMLANSVVAFNAPWYTLYIWDSIESQNYFHEEQVTRILRSEFDTYLFAMFEISDDGTLLITIDGEKSFSLYEEDFSVESGKYQISQNAIAEIITNLRNN